jgi:hypothetical protein
MPLEDVRRIAEKNFLIFGSLRCAQKHEQKIKHTVNNCVTALEVLLSEDCNKGVHEICNQFAVYGEEFENVVAPS